MKKRDFIVLGILILLIGISFLIVGLTNKKSNTAYVYLKGELVKKIDLSVDDEYEIIEGFIVFVKDDKIGVKESCCDDETCIQMGTTNSSSKPIICAPNGIYIKVGDDSWDVVVG